MRIGLFGSLMLCLVTTPSLASGPKFSLGTLEGSYAWRGAGEQSGTPSRTIGLTVFDGRGGCFVSFSTTTAGLPIVRLDSTAGNCTYTVNSDGTGAYTATVIVDPATGAEVTFTGDIVIVSSDEYYFLVLDGTGTLQAPSFGLNIAKKQRPSGGDDDDD